MRHPFTPRLAIRLGLLFALGLHTLAQAADAGAQVGWRQIQVPGGALEPAATVVALYYPTDAVARPRRMGPFSIDAAMQAAPQDKVKGLIMLSHGTAGSELGHNWQDTSLRDGPDALQYFVRRPAQVSQAISHLLQDPLWKDRIASESQGPRIGVVGHSAGGYTVLALAGGRPDMARLAQHCSTERQADPIFCGVRRAMPLAAAAPAVGQAGDPAALPSPADPRVRAVVAMAPVGVPLAAGSLASIRVPTLLYAAENDRFLVPRFHADWISRHMPQAQRITVPGAWHFAFMDTPSMPLPTPDGDIGADPPGFDRAALHSQLGRALPAFFDQAWTQPATGR
jgi:predicted dienelactone hydrolase